MTKFFAVALAALTVFSCSKENGGPEGTTDTRKVTISVSSPKLSKAVDTPVAEETAVAITDGIIYFTGADGTILQGTKRFVATDLQVPEHLNKITCDGVSSDAKMVYVVANNTVSGANQTFPVTGNISAVKALASTISTTSQNVIGSVVISGEGAITIKPTPEVSTAKVILVPALSRVEISSLDGNRENDGAESQITSFKVKGIYLDNHLTTFAFDGVSGTGLHATGIVPAQLAAAPFADIFATAVEAANKVLNPGAGNVWAYQIATAAKNKVPSIIIQLEDVVVGTTTLGTRFVTVKTYNEAGTQTLYEEDIVKGHVYKISNISFNESHLALTPNAETISVEVEITVENWVLVPLDPIL